MKLTQKEQESIENIRNISHENVERIHSIFNALMTYSLMNYTENEPIVIPYFGSFLVKYRGDDITNDGREAKIEVYFDPSPSFKENIGAYEDFKSSKNKDITKIPIIRQLAVEQTRALKLTMNDMLEPIEDD
jgi:hypothetical protein